MEVRVRRATKVPGGALGNSRRVGTLSRMSLKIRTLLAADAATAKEELDALTPEQLLAPAKIISREDALLAKAALYLKHGYLDASHKISQQVETPNGSYWHAIMHRKEGDFSNSKYWYRRVGPHPVLLALGKDFDPLRFVDQSAKGESAETAKWEQAEFEALLEHTLRAAMGE